MSAASAWPSLSSLETAMSSTCWTRSQQVSRKERVGKREKLVLLGPSLRLADASRLDYIYCTICYCQPVCCKYACSCHVYRRIRG